MKAYLDTSALAKLYVPEKDSEHVVQWIEASKQSVIFSSFQELELKNAIALKKYRKEMDPSGISDVIKAIEKDKRNGLLVTMPFGWPEIFDLSIDLAIKHSSTLGTRSLDVFHVAIASYCRCTHFLSFDDRQMLLAKAAGMKIVTIR